MFIRVAAPKLVSIHSRKQLLFPTYRKLITKTVHSFCTPNRICHSFCSVSKLNLPIVPVGYSRGFHLGSTRPCSNEDIPLYLQDIANEVTHKEEDNDIFDILEDEVDDQENDIENEIVDFFLARALSYEEMEGSFTAACPSCGHKDKLHDLFIDKNSGYSVCPWCSWDGTWEDLVDLFDSREDCLSQEQLDLYLSSLHPIKGSHSKLFNASPFKNVGINKLKSVGAGVSEDQSQIGIPLYGGEGQPTGFVTISLLHPKPKVVQRFVEGQSGIFINSSIEKKKKTIQNMLIVSNIFDAFHLSKFKIDAIVVNSELNESTICWIFKNVNSVVLCLENRCIPVHIDSYFRKQRMKCSAMRLGKNKPLTSLSEKEIEDAIKESIPIISNDIVGFRDLQSEVYNRIIDKDKIHGVKWTRYTELNNLLLGHREGELTIFTGLTGSGKTTFMSEYSLDLCMQGVCTLWGSFEVALPRLCEVMLQQYFGGPLPKDWFEFRNLASKFTQMPLYFLNFHGQKRLSEVIQVMTESVLTKGVKHIIIDNLQFMLGMQGVSTEWWLEQDKAVGSFRQFASSLNCHLTLIVHPRKLHAGEKLNFHSISGGARVTQEADNIMILQSDSNKDGTTNNFGPKTLQIVKNRYGGTLGEMRLRFHKDSLTLSSIHKAKDKSDSQYKNNNSLIDVKGLPMLNLGS